MNKIWRNILGLLAGIIVGWFVNMGIILISDALITPPEGVNPTDFESLKASFHLYEPKHFIMPFLAHALGALFGSFVAAKIAASHKLTFAFVVGGFFFLGGLAMVVMLPETPVWFIILDLGLAYFPMGWLGYKIAKTKA